ncbi:hypothetical protein VTN96DRAFT_6601 [Rasamsonia emersonii]
MTAVLGDVALIRSNIHIVSIAILRKSAALGIGVPGGERNEWLQQLRDKDLAVSTAGDYRLSTLGAQRLGRPEAVNTEYWRPVVK